MTMLVDPDLALGTLQTLARFQGDEVDPRTEEEPGRILHEMRFGETASLALGGGRIYYGTVDATPLFVMLLGELSRWGNRREEVDALLPGRRRARSQWITDYGDKDGDGYVEYQRTTDRGLAEPGLEGLLGLDALRRRLARGDADRAVRGAGLRVRRAHRARALRDRGRRRRARARRCATRADELKRRFNEDFWVETTDGGYFAIGPRPRQAADRRHRLEHGPLPLDRHRRRGEGAARRAHAAVRRRCSAAGVSARCRPTNDGLQPDLVPLRQRVAARQRDLRRGPHALRLRRRSAPRDARASSTRRRGSATCCPSCSPACRATGSASR